MSARQVRILVDSKGDGLKAGQIAWLNAKGAQHYVEHGWAEYIIEEKTTDAPGTNVERDILVKRLLEAGFDSRRFLKINEAKAAFEIGFQDKLYTAEELEAQGWPYWGIIGKDGLVLIDADRSEMEAVIRKVLPATFEVKSPRRGLAHFYFVVEGDKVPNKTLHMKGEEDGCGEIRAQNHYLVAPGTEIRYKEKATGEDKTGRYIIIQNKPFAKLQYADFMKVIEPYLGRDSKQRLTLEQIRQGVPQGIRHSQGIKYATYLIGVQLFDVDTALQAMREWNKLCQPPMDDKDLVRMVQSAVNYVQSEPRQYKHREDKKTLQFDVPSIERLENTAKNPAILDKIMMNLGKTVREDESVKFSVFFTCFSAYTSEPLNLFIRGPSSTGKTYGAVQTSQFFPKNDIVYIGAASPKFLIRQQGVLVDASGQLFTLEEPKKPRKSQYGKGKTQEYEDALTRYEEEEKQYEQKRNQTHTLIDLSGKTLLFLESPSFELFHMLKPILSHDKEEISFPYVDKEAGRIRTINVTVRGWPASMFLKAEDQYIEELATRSFTISPVESKEKYEAGNEVTNEFASYPWEKTEIRDYRREVQTFIEYLKREIKGKRYILPFALNSVYPHDLPRDMRDFTHLLQLIQCVTLLHAKQRLILSRNGEEFIVSNLHDVEFAFAKFKAIFETTRTGLSQHILSFYHDIVKEMPIAEESTLPEGKRRSWKTSELVAKYNEKYSPKRSRRTILRYLELLEEIGYVQSEGDEEAKRSSVWKALQEKPKENGANSDFEQLSKDLKPKLEKSLKEWFDKLGHTKADFYTEKIGNEPQWLSWSDAEKIVLCCEVAACHDLVKAESAFDSDLKPKASAVPPMSQDAQIKARLNQT